ncbi:MAG: T9SS type A sorting domain-containing protein [Chitinophagales bacterium]|nr:T9SS type A sorting domain-containing protein [Chitinophagales bacterium]
MAVAFLTAGGSIEAQIIYTDVVPDEILSDSADFFEIDFNSDALPEFRVGVFLSVFPDFFSLTTDTSKKYDLINKQVFIYPENDNAVIGYTLSTVSGGYLVFPLALDDGEGIDEGGDFYEKSIQNMAFYWGVMDFPSAGYSSSYLKIGTWTGEGAKYVGVRFELDGDNYYGWIRMEVDSNHITTTIYDFAYNAAPETAIETGQLVVIKNLLDASKVYAYSYDKTVHVVTNNIQAKTATIKITNSTGQTVYTNTLDQSGMRILLDHVAFGIYSIHIVADGAVYTKNVMIN